MIKKIQIPIYDCTLYIGYSDPVWKVRAKLNDVFGSDPTRDYDALCSYRHLDFGLFFCAKSLKISVIAHEVFHLTHRILELFGTNFDASHHEHAAILNEYLIKVVLETFKIKDYYGKRNLKK